MFCPHCGIQLLPNARFCQGCGKPTDIVTAPVRPDELEGHQPVIVMPRPSFSGIRKMNWAIASILAAGLIIMIFKVPTFMGILAVALFGGLLVGFPVVTAVALGGQDISILSLYIAISAERQRNLQKISLVLNWIAGGFGVIGLVACVADQQFGPMISMLIYVLPPYLNIRSLQKLRKFEMNHRTSVNASP